MEAVGYVLLYFLRGRLPWQGIPVKNKEERYRKIMEKKIETFASELCQGFPMQFAQYINYTRNLKSEEDPNYSYLKDLFVSTLNDMGHKIDCYYDWDKKIICYNRNFYTDIRNCEASTASNSNRSQNNIRDINGEKNKRNSKITQQRYSIMQDISNISIANNFTNHIGSVINNDFSVINTNTKMIETENGNVDTQNKSTQQNIKDNLETIKEENIPQNNINNDENEIDIQKKVINRKKTRG